MRDFVNSPGGLQLFAEDGDAAQASGVTAAAAEPQTEAMPESGPAESFADLIHGRYKAEYDESVQRILRQRLKASRETEAKYRTLEPAIAILEKKYGVEAGDLASLERAIQAEAAPPSREQEAARAAFADRMYNDWMAQAARTKAVFPDFDLRREMENPQFGALLQSQVDMTTAYQAVHQAEIIPAAMEYAARTVEEKLAGSLRSGASRPAENGSQGQGAILLGGSASQLSPKEYAEVCKRVARGERVSFG